MSKKYWIGTAEEYSELVVTVEADKTIHQHSPIYNQDRSMVLVAGYGDLTTDEVKAYQNYNDWYATEEQI